MKHMKWLAAGILALAGVAGAEARDLRGSPEQTREYQKKRRKAQKQAIKNQHKAAKQARVKKSPKKKGRVQYGVKQTS
jgi:hypothetical protein